MHKTYFATIFIFLWMKQLKDSEMEPFKVEQPKLSPALTQACPSQDLTLKNIELGY